MNPHVLSRGISTSWRGLTIAVVSLGLLLWMALYAYGQMDLSIYDQFPEALRALMGIPPKADAATLAYNAMLDAFGALTVVGVAIALGASAVAGEETERTVSLVLSTGVSRVSFALSKAVALALLLAAAGLGLWLGAWASGMAVGVDIGEAHLGAVSLGIAALAFFHAGLAFAVACATGNRGLGAGVAAAVAVLGWLASGLIPMWVPDSRVVDAIPWAWFSGGSPLVNGVEGWRMALLLGGGAALIALGVAAFQVRDLRLAPPSALADRLRALRGIRLGGGKGGSLFSLAFGSYRRLLWVVAVLMLTVMGMLMPPLYSGMQESLEALNQTLPAAMMAFVGATGDFTTPEGFIQAETMGLMAPIAVILVGLVAAAQPVAGEERRRRLGLLLGHPVPRARVIATALLNAVLYVGIVSAATFLGLWIGVLIADLDVPAGNIAAACVLLFGLGMVHACLGLLVAAATGRPERATWIVVGFATLGFFGQATLMLMEAPRAAHYWTPFFFYGDSFAMGNGLDVVHLLCLLGAAAVLAALAFPAFQRRDLNV